MVPNVIVIVGSLHSRIVLFSDVMSVIGVLFTVSMKESRSVDLHLGIFPAGVPLEQLSSWTLSKSLWCATSSPSVGWSPLLSIVMSSSLSNGLSLNSITCGDGTGVAIAAAAASGYGSKISIGAGVKRVGGLF